MKFLTNTLTGNAASNGGGGALLWDGDMTGDSMPQVRKACDPGWAAEADAHSDGREHCVPCAPGSWKDNIDAATCTRCKVGKFSVVPGAVDESTCVLCPAGKFQNEAGRSSCQTCPAHSTSTAKSTKSACLCDAGFFGDGVTSCQSCIANATSFLGSSNQSHCFCDAGFAGDAVTSCQECLPNATSGSEHVCSTYYRRVGTGQCRDTFDLGWPVLYQFWDPKFGSGKEERKAVCDKYQDCVAVTNYPHFGVLHFSSVMALNAVDEPGWHKSFGGCQKECTVRMNNADGDGGECLAKISVKPQVDTRLNTAVPSRHTLPRSFAVTKHKTTP
ncbi:MAG: hypothetical protein ACPIOQ_71110, partial [Promethearchaeia archaeon]